MQRTLSLILAWSLMVGSGGSSVYAMDPSMREKIFSALTLGTPHVKNEILVQFSPTSTDNDKNRVLDRIRGKKLETIAGPSSKTRTFSSQGDLERVSLPPGLAVADAIRSIENDSSVVFAEPNWIYQHHATSNDVHFTNGNLWGMYSGTSSPPNQFGSQATVAWTNNKTDCSGVYVGIIDEGYMYSHADLSANASTNPNEIPGNGLDDDKNGYTDDVYGWDFDGNNNSVFDGSQDDHGTHVAGTIGGVGGNGVGVAGVCWKVNLLNAKFLGVNGGTTSNAIKAVDYMTNLKKNGGLNIVATNNSWGGGGFSQGLADAIARAGLQNILFVVAAGNSGYNCDYSYRSCFPAEYTLSNLRVNYPNAIDNVISVASLDSNGALSSYSNYGKSMIDLGAPGRSIVSTVPNCTVTPCSSGYASYNGTSMATPHVTGAVALFASLNSTLTAAQIKSGVLGKTTDTASLNGKTLTGKRLSVGGF